MALLAGGKLDNVYASLDRYVTIQLVDSAGFAVRLHGVRRFVPPVDDPWIECHYDFLGLQESFRRQIGGGAFGVERQGYLQLNCYQRTRVFTQRYTTARMRDTVVGAFPEGSFIPVYDFAGEAPDTPPEEVALVVIDGLQEHVQDTGLRSGIMQHVLQVRTRYLEHFTR